MKPLLQAATGAVFPGQLDTLVTIEREVRTADGYAGATREWEVVEQAWAAVSPLFVGEREQLGAVRNVTQHRMFVYRTDTVDERMRIVVDSVVHQIKGIKRGGPSEIFMELITETGLED